MTRDTTACTTPYAHTHAYQRGGEGSLGLCPDCIRNGLLPRGQVLVRIEPSPLEVVDDAPRTSNEQVAVEKERQLA